MRSFHWPGRSPVYGRRGMCATAHPLASLAAVETLRAGGNAVDAAVTACAVLCVVEPAMTGIGGDCFAMIARPGAPLVGLSGCGRSPAAARPEWFAERGIAAIEVTSPHAVNIPGSIDGWARVLADHGTISLDRALTPAIGYAENGFPVAPRVALDWMRGRAKLERQAGARQHYLRAGKVPVAGQMHSLPALGRTLRAIAEDGPKAFYEGRIAEDMVATLKDLGGLHTLEDFAAQGSTHGATYVEPISVAYRGVELCELPPSNQGIVALLLLRMLDRLGPVPAGPASAERYHLLIECARLAYAVRDAYVSDPDTATVPVEELARGVLSDAYVDGLVARVDPRRRTPDLGPVPHPTGSDTTYLTVVDERGMAVSFINSLFADFGSGIVAPHSGVVLNNRGIGFSLDAAHPNAIGPRKRPMHTLVPAIAMREGKPWLSFGVMGGAFQPTGHVFVLTSLVDYGLDAQEALDLPRVFFEGGETVIEESLPQDVATRLSEMGHTLRVRDLPWGGGQIVMIDHARDVLVGASDARKDGCALGY